MKKFKFDDYQWQSAGTFSVPPGTLGIRRPENENEWKFRRWHQLRKSGVREADVQGMVDAEWVAREVMES